MNLPTPQPLSSASVDETTIRALFEQLLACWNRGDGMAYAALFEEDADYIAFNGSHTQGQAAIATQHQQLFDAPLKGTRLCGSIKQLRFLSPDIALVYGIGGMLMSWQSDHAKPGRQSIQTLVARKRDGQWRFVAFHNNRIHPIGIDTIAAGIANFLWQKLFVPHP